MTVAELFTDVRYQLSDEQKSGYSDNELIGYLNQTNDYVFATLIDASSNLAIKEATITLVNGEASLPEDFQAEDSIITEDYNKLLSITPSEKVTQTTFKVLGNTIYSDNDTIIMYYFYMPTSYTAITDTLNIPKYFKNLYIQMVKFLTLNTDEYETSVEQALMMRFESNIMSIAGKRGNSNPQATMPFMV